VIDAAEALQAHVDDLKRFVWQRGAPGAHRCRLCQCYQGQKMIANLRDVAVTELARAKS